MKNISLRDATELEVRTLQRLALIGLGRWLEVGHDAAVPDSDGLAGGAALMTRSEDQTRVTRKAVAQWSGRFQVTEPPSWTVTQVEWIAPDLLLPWWRRWSATFFDRLTSLLGRAPPDFIAVAPCLLDPVTQQSWGCPVFRRSVARMIRSHLKARVIMLPDGGGVPELALPTLWAATAFALETLTDVNDQKWGVLRARVRATTSNAFASEQWAGFWDAYVLNRARALGADLPGPVIALDLAPTPPLPEYLSSDWRDSVPGFASQLMNNTI
ncbi:hypothetical protein [Roseovarius pelagicus]|uniref:Uncharacterized protein n=1 Tax=Roseovarius pelagicus TaxID=2980108 RepID=A0ABY6DCD5_9RHOB|nr:hypothetical protein [Roseovarius pelagicus]UXX83801.1 hypothetical protein N7U68_03835 [Roseovarius pelagicus]